MKSTIAPYVFLIIIVFAIGCAGPSNFVPVESSQSENDEPREPIVIKEFQLGPGDIVEITVWRNEDLNREAQVGSSGNIYYPLVGTVQAGGLSIFELRDGIAEGLAEYLVNPQVGINVVEYQSKKIIVLGEVLRPGVFQDMGKTSALEAISMAGGFTRDAKPKTILLIRGDIDNPQLLKLNLQAALKKGDIAQNIYLEPGDVLYVPTSVFASTERFFRRIDSIITPIVKMETGIILEPLVEDVFRGEEDFNNIDLIVTP